MRNRQQSFILFCAVSLALATGGLHTAAAQETQASNTVTRSWGVGASFQGGQTLIIVPIWLGQRFNAGPIVSATHTENVNLTLNAGLAARYYTSMTRIAPYWGAAATATINKPQNGGNSATAWTVGGFFGGEFFINQKFSLAVQPGVFAIFPPNSGPITITTTTFLFGTVYF
jgi:hypothetical protein